MFDIVFEIMLEFIDMLKWFIPMLIVFSVIARLIGGKR